MARAKIRSLLAAVCLFFSLGAVAQCEMENTAFNGGETLVYDLYFNWKFVWVKVGSATMVTRKSVFEGQEGFRSSLITRGNATADKLFVMRDTLTSVVDEYLVPLYYRKGALEGKQYRVDEVWYSYPDGVCSLKQRYRNPRGKVTNTSYTSPEECVQDMMSMFLRARSFDASQFKKGHRLHFKMADGDDVKDRVLVYRGKQKFKMESTNVTYRCLVFSFVEENKKGGEDDVITFYVTDDQNHLPVRLDMNLRIGSAKAFLTAKTGVRHPMSSVVK